MFRASGFRETFHFFTRYQVLCVLRNEPRSCQEVLCPTNKQKNRELADYQKEIFTIELYHGMRDGNIKLMKEKRKYNKHTVNMYRGDVTHLIDVFEFVNDLIYHRVGVLHLDLWVSTLSFYPIADHTEGVAVNRVEKTWSL